MIKTSQQMQKSIDALLARIQSKAEAEASLDHRLQNVSAMDLLIVGRLRAIKYQESKNADSNR
jgi:hypothetical protein